MTASMAEAPEVRKTPETVAAPEVPVRVEVRAEPRETAAEAPEAVPETAAEAPAEAPQEAAPPPAPVAVKAASPAKDRFTREIEAVLADDMTELFLKMPPPRQEEFKRKGEETAGKIRVLLSSAKVNVRKVLALIVDWLKMLPGVSAFFLEQEAKIKTDRLLLLAKAEREGSANDIT